MALLEIMRIVIQPVTEASKYLFVTIKRQASYFVHYKKNIENLKSEAEKLERKRNDIQRLVEVAQRNSQAVGDTVQEWLSNVQGVVADVQRSNDQVKGNMRNLDLCTRYKLSKNAKRNIAIINELQREGDFSSVSYPNRIPGVESLPRGDFFAFESTESTKKEIMDALKDENKNIIGVYGMGGIGKTTLVRQVAKMVKTEGLFEEVVMVTLTQNPDPRSIQSEVAEQLDMRLENGSVFMRARKLSERLNQEKSVLVILDNLWERLELADVGIPYGKEHKGSKIVFTTRSTEICNVMESQAKIAVNILSEQESWSLFREKAGDIIDTLALHDLAKEVERECGGLPLAIVTLGRALRDKNKIVWKHALLELQRSNPTNIKDMNAKVFTSLEMSYNYLESEEAKSCFLFCSLLPEGYPILINDLIRYGMGDGLFHDINTLEEASYRVHTLIDKLTASCLLLEGESDSCIKMHDVVRDVAISITSRNGHAFFVKAGVGLKEWPKMENLEECKRISLAKNNIAVLPGFIVAPQLLTLLLPGNYYLRKIPESFFTGMKALKVLDLRDTNISSLPSSMEGLENLQTLCLDRCRALRDVALIGRLKKLEILCLRESGIDRMPEEIGELTNLKLLDLSNTKLEIVPPNVISRLIHLEELYMGHSFSKWEPKGGKDARYVSITEIGFLTHLSVLDVHVENIKCMSQGNIGGPWKNLRKFQICIGGHYEYGVMQRFVKVENISIPIPSLVTSLLDRTTELQLICSRGLTIFANIHEMRCENLESLTIDKCGEMECVIRVGEEAPQPEFRSLKRLFLCHLLNLKKICNGALAATCLKNVRVLKVNFCSNLVNILPSYIVQVLKNLENLVVIDCEKLQEVFESEVLVEEHALLTSLKNLNLENLPKLSSIGKGAIPIGSLHNLEELNVEKCNLRYLLSPTFAQCAAQLTYLSIIHCMKMEKLIMEETCPSQLPPIGCFQSLRRLIIRRCHGFKSLFSTSLARDLACLNDLIVENCDEVVEIITRDENMADEGVLPQLKSLTLAALPNLTSFYEEVRIISFPSLEFISLYWCPQLKWLPLGPQSAPNLKEVESKKWTELEKLEWNDESVKSRLQNLLKERPYISPPLPLVLSWHGIDSL